MKRTAIALAVAGVVAQAEAVEGAPVAVVEIVGVAPHADADRNTLPYAVQTASGRELGERGENVVEYLDRRFAGIQVNDTSGNPFQADVTYRGYRASPVLGTAQGLSVYLDGVRINEPFGDVVNWDMLPESAIGSVLLAPAANPLYGLNTLGGALVLRTRSGRTDPGATAALSGSDRGRQRADVAYGIADGSAHAFAAATLYHDAGWRDHSASRLGNLFVKAGTTTGAVDWQLAALAGDSRLVGNGLLPDALYAQSRTAVYTHPDRTRNVIRQVQLTASLPLAGGTLNGSLHARNSRRDTVNGDVSDEYAEYVHDCDAGCDALPPHPAALNTTATRQHSRGADIGWQSGGDGARIVAGASVERSRSAFAQAEQDAWFADDRGVAADPDAEREQQVAVAGTSRTTAVYGAVTWPLAPDTWLTAAARYNHAQVANTLTNEGQAQPRERFRYAKLNPSLGIAHRRGAWTLFANGAQNNRVPTVIELGCADPAQPCRLPVGLQADPYLKQVVARTVEAGARWEPDARMGATATVYRSVNRDDILFRAAGLTQHGYFANFGRTVHSGADLIAHVRRGSVEANVSYSYLHAVYGADGLLFTGTRNVAVEKGTRLPGLPRHTAKADVAWHPHDAWTVGAHVAALSSRVVQGNEDGYVDGDGTRADLRIRGYALLSLYATYRVKQWEWFARIDNAANRRFETTGAVAADLFPGGVLAGKAALARFVSPGTPRTVHAGVKVRF